MLHRFDLLTPYPEVVAGYTDRQDGVSRGSFASFNTNSYCGDDPSAVGANREALERSLGMRLVTARQVHGTGILTVCGNALEGAPSGELADEADALVCAEPGLLIGVHTADCIPLLLYDPVQRVCAAVHAGWRGTVRGVTRLTIRYMEREFGCIPARMAVCIGPGISAEAFEVGDEVYEAFRDGGFPMRSIASHPAPGGKWHIDLKEANRHLLRQSGVTDALTADAGVCTFRDADYYSARRDGTRTGRLLTCIGLRPSRL